MRWSRRPCHVQAVWDPEAGAWVATSADVPGLGTEAIHARPHRPFDALQRGFEVPSCLGRARFEQALEIVPGF
ncbi:MAG TPA: DUF1902 domain-containing protein [Thermoanaerobaculia bacterium]|nr:DUF1902 domain-containing protein [Thermoanaerobaculia bacterium]